jgi:hypothetical protein
VQQERRCAFPCAAADTVLCDSMTGCGKTFCFHGDIVPHSVEKDSIMEYNKSLQ